MLSRNYLIIFYIHFLRTLKAITGFTSDMDYQPHLKSQVETSGSVVEHLSSDREVPDSTPSGVRRGEPIFIIVGGKVLSSYKLVKKIPVSREVYPHRKGR